MHQPHSLHIRWSPLQRYALALLIFLAALAVRLAWLPAESSWAYLTFLPATVVVFYLGGLGPGQLMTVLSTLTLSGYFIFSASATSVESSQHLALSVVAYVLSAQLVGAIVNQLRLTAVDLRSTLSALQSSEQRYQTILEDQTDVICRFRADGTVVYVNAAYCRLFGKTSAELVDQHWHPVVWPDDQAAVDTQLARLSPEQPVVTIENRIITAGGEVRWAQFVNRATFDEQGRLLEIQSVGRDITERRQLASEQQAMLNNDLVGIVRLRHRVVAWKNPAIDRIFGYEADELLGQSARRLYPSEEAYRAVGAEAYQTLQQGKRYRAQLPMVRKSGETLWIDVNGVQLSAENNESLWLLTDITALKHYQQQIEHIAFHDSLTGLPNRLLLADRLTQALALAERRQRVVAVCYLDLDDFKPVNDAHGHAAGDVLLKEVARRLRRSVRANDTVCRLGGDEFVLLLTHLEHADECDPVLQRVILAVNKPIELGEQRLAQVSASVGVALFPDHGAQPSTLLGHADAAMYAAKKLGRNRVHRHDSLHTHAARSTPSAL